MNSLPQFCYAAITNDDLLRSQQKLWEIRAEIESFASLFQVVGSAAEIGDIDLFGVGTWLKRLAHEIESVETRIGIMK